MAELDTAVKLAAAVEPDLAELVEGLPWISGPTAFVQSKSRQPEAE